MWADVQEDLREFFDRARVLLQTKRLGPHLDAHVVDTEETAHFSKFSRFLLGVFLTGLIQCLVLALALRLHQFVVETFVMGQLAIGHRHDGYGIAPGCVNPTRAGAVREIVRVRYDDENSEPLVTVACHLCAPLLVSMDVDAGTYDAERRTVS